MIEVATFNLCTLYLIRVSIIHNIIKNDKAVISPSTLIHNHCSDPSRINNCCPFDTAKTIPKIHKTDPQI